MRSLILQFFAIISIQALEKPIPAMFLQPKHFNPHPYQEEAKRFIIAIGNGDDPALEHKFYQQVAERFRNTGPVRFPENSEYDQRQQRQQQRNAISHILDQQAILTPPQYQRIALTRRPKKMRITTTDEFEVPRILSALANHARRVQNNEFQQNTYTPALPVQHQQQQQRYTNRIGNGQRHHQHHHHEEDDHESSSSTLEKKHYTFAYAVKDRHSGDDFSHNQKQENGAVQGSYKVRLPDNRIQITKYIADDNGYRADVTYEEDSQPYQEAPIVQQPLKSYTEPQPYYPQNTNAGIRYTVTPTPYSNSEYNHVRAPTIRKTYASTTALPQSIYYP